MLDLARFMTAGAARQPPVAGGRVMQPGIPAFRHYQETP